MGHSPSIILTSGQIFIVVLHESFHGHFFFARSAMHASDPEPAHGLDKCQVRYNPFGEDGLLHLGEGGLEVVKVYKAVVGPGVDCVGAVGHD
ncbi:hypothetical protein H648_34942gpHYPp4 [Human mastadenovirus B]|uniref:Uncharacterized protein n=2 Tax=Human mastadenovirus B TaxID=108098 RepID=T1UI34_9ADEN|nr:hypothetical 9.7 kDa protein [Human adenovirus 7]AGT75420.1 hypothetical protein H648_34941gpHYPp4 [Human mastadenovirus B]AGT75755.1 hypothetical protein H648_37077gpHYPp4 [Human mastadenovirus B]AGT75799.1 hypothetical protein H648_34943gpHYPp4 [Human mastadenovirus B]AGT76190.1 hypothetical protein H648_34942gpHYPp4 [Human mastadenovirus B]